MTPDLDDTFTHMMRIALKEPKPLMAMMLKLVEEVGELAEAVNHHQGYLPHKTMKEPPEGEVADVINCAVSILVKLNPGVDIHELLYGVLKHQLITKNAKWERIVDEARNDQ